MRELTAGLGIALLLAGIAVVRLPPPTPEELCRFSDREIVESSGLVATGDRLQLKFNGRSRDGQRIANGELVTVRQVNCDGSIAVETDAELRRQRVRIARGIRDIHGGRLFIGVFDLGFGQRRAAIETPMHRLGAA